MGQYVTNKAAGIRTHPYSTDAYVAVCIAFQHSADKFLEP